MDFNVNDWLGEWISFEHLINNHDPNLDRAWKDSTKAMRSKPLFAIMMLGDARRFWAKACKTSAWTIWISTFTICGITTPLFMTSWRV